MSPLSSHDEWDWREEAPPYLAILGFWLLVLVAVVDAMRAGIL